MITHHMCQHGGKSWPYWFRKMGIVSAVVEIAITDVAVIVEGFGAKMNEVTILHHLRQDLNNLHFYSMLLSVSDSY